MASNDFGVPSELDNEALEKALAEAYSRGETLAKVEDDDITDEQIDEMSTVADFITAAKQEQASRQEAAAERSNKLAELRSKVVINDEKDDEEKEEEAPSDSDAPSEDAPTAEEDEDEDEDKRKRPGFSEESTETAANEGDKNTSTDKAFAEDEEEDDSDDNSDDSKEDEKKESAATEEIPSTEDSTEEKENADVPDNDKASLANAAKHAPQHESMGDATKFSLTAAANVQGITAGKSYTTLKEATEAISQSARALPTTGKNRAKNPALTFSMEREHVQGVTGNDTETLMAAGSERRLSQGSLVAAGGWAAPSEQLLDFCSIETAEGLVDLPSITVNRGGVNYTKGPSFDDVLNSATGFWDMTEATAEAGTEEKTSIRPEAPSFEDVRLDAVGVMVEAGLLTRAGWPELVERYAQLAVLAHQVKVHHKLIQGVTDYTGPAVDVASGYGNAIDILNILDVVIAGERQRFSMGQNGTVEAWIPVWVRNVLRADLANRTGVDLLEVNDARINGWFASRGARVQWLQHWQDLEYTDGVAQGYPEQVEMVVYPAGTFVKGEEDVLTLDTVYDSVNLKKNDYVHLFMEQGILVANPCYEGRRVRFPVNINGRTAAADITTDFGTTTPGGEG